MGRRIEKKRPATYADVLAAPEHVVAELVDGTLYTRPRPASTHARAASELMGELRNPFGRGIDGPGGWIILIEPELHLVGQVLVPDVAGWRRERMPELPHVAAFELAPDWICEILSPSTAVLDRKRKLPRYAQAGVGHAWIVDPDAQTLEVFRRQGDGWYLVASFGEDDRVRAEPFDAVEIELANLWAR